MMIMQLLAGLVAFVQPTPQPEKQAQATTPPAGGSATVAELCKARQFETIVEFPVDGKTRRSRIRLCGEEGQTDAEWVRTLRDAASKIGASRLYPETAKAEAIQAIEGEIAKFAQPEPAIVEIEAAIGGTSALPLPPKAASPLPLPQPSLDAPGYSVLPSLNTKPPVPAKPAPVAATSVPAPLVTLSCAERDRPQDFRPCSTIDRDTIIGLRADGLVRNARLRFVRKGETRAELPLDHMRPGSSRTLRLPAAVCTGIFRGTVEIAVLEQQSATATTKGPFALRC